MEGGKVEFKGDGGFGEAHSYGLEYSLLSKRKNTNGYVAIHSPVLCKDFLSDLLWAEHTNNRVSIYGFSWRGGQRKSFNIKTKKTFRLGIRLKGRRGLYENLEAPKLQEFLNEFEDLVGLPHSKVLHINDREAVVEFDKEWTTQPVRVSLFTLLVRVGLRYNGCGVENWIAKIHKYGNGAVGSGDASLLHEAQQNFDNIFKRKCLDFNQTYKQYSKVDVVHGYSGIANFKTWNVEKT